VVVLEVKSSFEPHTVRNAINKLKELKKFMEVDEPNERYKKYLPVNFCCGTVFFELKKQHRKKAASLENNLAGFELRNYRGSVILEAEGLNEPYSARIELGSSDTPINTIQTTGTDLLGMQFCGHPQPDKDGRYNCVILKWSHVEFSQFLFELIAIWNGTYDGRAPSFHGLSYINPDAD
jgi:hypothetical protein